MCSTRRRGKTSPAMKRLPRNWKSTRASNGPGHLNGPSVGGRSAPKRNAPPEPAQFTAALTTSPAHWSRRLRTGRGGSHNRGVGTLDQAPRLRAILDQAPGFHAIDVPMDRDRLRHEGMPADSGVFLIDAIRLRRPSRADGMVTFPGGVQMPTPSLYNYFRGW